MIRVYPCMTGWVNSSLSYHHFLSEGVTESEVDDTIEDGVRDEEYVAKSPESFEDEDAETHARFVRSSSNVI